MDQVAEDVGRYACLTSGGWTEPNVHAAMLPGLRPKLANDALRLARTRYDGLAAERYALYLLGISSEVPPARPAA